MKAYPHLFVESEFTNPVKDIIFFKDRKIIKTEKITQIKTWSYNSNPLQIRCVQLLTDFQHVFSVILSVRVMGT